MTAFKLFICFLFVFYISAIVAQSDSAQNNTTKPNSLASMFKNPHSYNWESLGHLYPLRDNPTVGYRSNMTNKEKILFDVHPVLSLSFFNDFQYKMNEKKKFSQGYYFLFRPHFRMYNEASTPVKMTSFKLFLGFSHTIRLTEKHLFSYGIQSGHYSNGQSGSAIQGGGIDGSSQSDSMWATITPATSLSNVINRKDGDFSTNLSEIMFNHKYITKLDAYNKPKEIHAFAFGVVMYHNNVFGLADFGGYSPQSIAIYGKYRTLYSYQYTYIWKRGYRIIITENIEIIHKPHASVNPFRTQLQPTFYLPKSLGFFITYIYGHDDYNLRFVDAGHQFGIGMTWDINPPVEMEVR